MKLIFILITLILCNILCGQEPSLKKLKIEKEKINVCGKWDWVGAREGYEISVDSFKLSSTTQNSNSTIVYTRKGQFLNLQEGDSMYYGTYKVDNISKSLTWNEKLVNERNYKILYYNNKEMLLAWGLEGIIVTYYFRRTGNCE